MQQGERRVLRVKRTLNSCFLCVAQLLKSANSGHPRNVEVEQKETRRSGVGIRRLSTVNV